MTASLPFAARVVMECPTCNGTGTLYPPNQVIRPVPLPCRNCVGGWVDLPATVPFEIDCEMCPGALAVSNGATVCDYCARTGPVRPIPAALLIPGDEVRYRDEDDEEPLYVWQIRLGDNGPNPAAIVGYSETSNWEVTDLADLARVVSPAREAVRAAAGLDYPMENL